MDFEDIVQGTEFRDKEMDFEVVDQDIVFQDKGMDFVVFALDIVLQDKELHFVVFVQELKLNFETVVRDIVNNLLDFRNLVFLELVKLQELFFENRWDFFRLIHILILKTPSICL